MNRLENRRPGNLFIVLFLLLMPSILSCDPLSPANQTLRKRMVEAIEPIVNLPVGDTITIDMAKVANFQWDTMYVFTTATFVGTINMAIGTSWPGSRGLEEYDNLFIFMRKGEIADYILFRGSNYQGEPNFIKFEGLFDTGELYTPQTAKLKVTYPREYPNHILVFEGKHTKPIFRPAFEAEQIKKRLRLLSL